MVMRGTLKLFKIFLLEGKRPDRHEQNRMLFIHAPYCHPLSICCGNGKLTLI